ncbi:MarR family winged helix-turn-helix transcriptional regulator [Nakamurella endophytica]|uniref:MarR family transcriptional regulator n=1 Tax=Nakamurella endophytica TaxID=1748367 RepID=A0A917WHF8_9ACTN|nr:MarR family transcriptional regulator [Nakamurella endophytica]GGM05234.1 MarR family transcriptional regulator [Nakamurella endophytica]
MRGDPWLSDDQQRVWRSYLALHALLNERIERDMQQASGMPHAYYLVLAMLSEAPERTLRMSQLADLAQMSQSRLSHAVARLEEKGWVRRTPAPDDRRGQLATLTAAGYDQLVEVAPSHADTVRSFMFDPLSDQQLAALGEICQVILDRAGHGSATDEDADEHDEDAEVGTA